VFKSAAAAARKVEQMKKLEEEQREQDREEGREREGTRERKKWGDRKKGRGRPSSLPRGIPPLSKNTLDLAKFHSIVQKRSIGPLNEKEEKDYRKSLDRFEEHMCNKAHVVVSTCVNCDRWGVLANSEFRCVLVDEATQATEPQVLIPLKRPGVEQVCFVGDHWQLGPVINVPEARRAGFSMSLFERLVLMGLSPSRLEVQYRMHPRLATFPSQQFYEGALVSGVTEHERELVGNVSEVFIKPNVPMMFIHNSAVEETSSSGTSFVNRSEADTVLHLVAKLRSSGVSGEDIGVITPYSGQRQYIIQRSCSLPSVPPEIFEGVEVASVDEFQGREKEVIVLSCVRSDGSSDSKKYPIIGFLKDPRRLNVALTRARRGLIIVGNINMLSKEGLWNSLIVHFQTQGCICSGEVDGLKPYDKEVCTPIITRPYKHYSPPDGVMEGEERKGMVELKDMSEGIQQLDIVEGTVVSHEGEGAAVVDIEQVPQLPPVDSSSNALPGQFPMDGFDPISMFEHQSQLTAAQYDVSQTHLGDDFATIDPMSQFSQMSDFGGIDGFSQENFHTFSQYY
ncbi:Regulator of nonsense transcripts 1 homolog, partial [Aduncisulcus paluster]